MKTLIQILTLISLSLTIKAQVDPRKVSFAPGHVSNDITLAQDTTKSIVIYGAAPRKGLYSVNGLQRPMTYSELENLLITFYRDFPKDAKSKTAGFEGLQVPKPNILYSSGSWAELENDGRDLAIKIAKNNNVSLHYFTISSSFIADSQIQTRTKISDHSNAYIDYYDKRLTATASTLWPDKNPSQEDLEKVSIQLDKVWKNGKITPEQPFKAKVVAAGGMSPWSGYTAIYLQEIEGHNRFLEVTVPVGGESGISYKILENKGDKIRPESLPQQSLYHSVIHTDPLHVKDFIHKSAFGYIGAVFGEQDMVRKSYREYLLRNKPSKVK